MSKNLSYQRKFTPKKSNSIREIITDLVYDSDMLDYLEHMKGEELVISFSPASSKAEKELMYAYYHKVVLSVAIGFYTDLGWEAIDKYAADELLKEHCAKDFIYNTKTGEKKKYLEEKKRMSKARLHKYISDCIFFLESNGYKVPESENYFIENKLGIKGFE